MYVTELAWHVGDKSYSFGAVTEMRHARFSIFDPKGKLLARWGTPDCTAPGSFAAPHGLALDTKNDLYVSEVTWRFAVSRFALPRTATHSRSLLWWCSGRRVERRVSIEQSAALCLGA